MNNNSGRTNNSMGRIRRLIRKIVYVLLAVAAAAWGAILMMPSPVPVKIMKIAAGPFAVTVSEEGKTAIRSRYTVSSPLAGFLNRTSLRAGDPVRRGETVLAVLDAESSGLLSPRALAEGEARQRAAEAARSLRKAELDRARLGFDLAKKQFERIDRLMPSGGIAKQDWDIAENRMQLLSREAKAAEFALRMAEFDVEQARSSLIQGQEKGKSSEPVRILSPVDGYVLKVFEESARPVQAGTPLLEVGNPEDLEGETDLFSADAAGVVPGMEVSIEGWGGEESLRGRVSAVERSGFTKVSALGVEEQRVKVRVDILDPVPPGYRLGDRFRIIARIVVRSDIGVLQVPLSALFRRGTEWHVFTAEGGRALDRKVETGDNNGIMAEVLSGLAEGDLVILHPSEKIRDGVKVLQE
jgi:HlyD family secretion protein